MNVHYHILSAVSRQILALVRNPLTIDSFRDNVQNVEGELDAWLSFLIKDDIESVVKLVEAHPEFAEMYQEIAEFRRVPKELIGMVPEALYIMDRNTEKCLKSKSPQISHFSVRGITKAEFDSELQRGIDSIKNGRTHSVEDVDRMLAKEFGI